MSLNGARILLTGAAGGIGRALASEFSRRGARLALVDQDERTLAATCEGLATPATQAHPVVADLTRLAELEDVVARAERVLGGLDVLVNNAGGLSFRPFERETAASLQQLHTLNVLAPMVLTQAAVARFRRSDRGRIVNIGSIFGSIAFAWFASYSASKFALRGFSEALRRELAGTGLRVTYVAPRATRTPLSQVFGRMAEATGMRRDDPAHVARRIARAIERDEKDVYLGFPEGLFVRVNALLPRLVDGALAKKDALARPYAEEADACFPAAGRGEPGAQSAAPTPLPALPPGAALESPVPT